MNFKAAYFIGVGGVGMSAIARFFKKEGKVVYGHDNVNTRLTDQLESEGVVINYSDSIESIPKEIISLTQRT